MTGQDLTPQEHEHSEAVMLAARWLAEQRPSPSPVVPALRDRFGLTAVEACEAIAEASSIMAGRSGR